MRKTTARQQTTRQGSRVGNKTARQQTADSRQRNDSQLGLVCWLAGTGGTEGRAAAAARYTQSPGARPAVNTPPHQVIPGFSHIVGSDGEWL